MRIVDAKTRAVANLPPHRGGPYWIFLELTTDDGVSGYGEAYGVPFSPAKVCGLVEDVVERRVIGGEPFDIESLWRVIYSSGFSLHPELTMGGVLSGIEIACGDTLCGPGRRRVPARKNCALPKTEPFTMLRQWNEPRHTYEAPHDDRDPGAARREDFSVIHRGDAIPVHDGTPGVSPTEHPGGSRGGGSRGGGFSGFGLARAPGPGRPGEAPHDDRSRPRNDRRESEPQ